MNQPDYISIPMPALADDKLQVSDKLLVGYIYWLTKLALMKCVASNATLAELTGLSERNIQKALNRLEEQGYVRRIYADKLKRNRLEIQCTLAYSAERTVGRTRTSHTTLASELSDTILIQDNNTDLNNTKVLAKAGNADINDMFEYWEKTTGIPIASRTKQNRFACSNLIKKHGAVGVRRLIGGVAQAQNDQYAPRIADFTQLQSKLGDLLLWGKKKSTKRGVTI